MCNIYQFKNTQKAADTFRTAVLAAAAGLATSVIRKTDPAVVVRAGGAVAVMRWGLVRTFNPAINNIRAEKLDSGMWNTQPEQRCVIPVTTFWEWGATERGKKQAHQISHPAGDWFWMAGIWEQDPDRGACFSMLTTAANPAMAALHDRMPAIVGRKEANAWLYGQFQPQFPYAGDLHIEPCASPLKKENTDNPQDSLF